MSENQENLEKDIKPVRPDASFSRLPRRTKGTVSLFSGVLTILNLVGLIVLFLWFFNTSGNQQQAGQNFIERISLIEEGLLVSNKKNNELGQTLETDLKFVNKEIRKLWDLSNKKNRRSIANNLNTIQILNEEIEKLSKQNETISAKQRALNLELAKMKNLQEKANAAMDGLNNLSGENLDKEKIKDIEDSIDSFNAYRVQVNQSLIALGEQLNQIELIIRGTENE